MRAGIIDLHAVDTYIYICIMPFHNYQVDMACFGAKTYFRRICVQAFSGVDGCSGRLI